MIAIEKPFLGSTGKGFDFCGAFFKKRPRRARRRPRYKNKKRLGYAPGEEDNA